MTPSGSPADPLALALFDILGWAKRYNPERAHTPYCEACGHGDYSTYDPLPDGILSGDRDNPEWAILAARLREAGVITKAEVVAAVEGLDLDALNPETNRSEVLAAIEGLPGRG